MLPKSRRLARQDFISNKQSGKNLKLPWASLVISPNTFGFNRWAIVTSAKLDKRAVGRNRLRRDIYDSTQALSGNYDIIVFPNKQAFKLSRTQICQTLKRAINI